MPKPSKKSNGSSLEFAVRDLRKSMEKIPHEFEYVINPGKHLILTYVRGIVYGLGALTAVAIVIPLMVWMMQRIAWVPVLGDFVTNIVQRVEQQQGR